MIAGTMSDGSDIHTHFLLSAVPFSCSAIEMFAALRALFMDLIDSLRIPVAVWCGAIQVDQEGNFLQYLVTPVL